jgi:hypothetical protein
MKILLLAAVLASATPAFAQTTVPATPTLHANAAFKGLQFDWAPAARASWYQLEYRAHQTGDFVQIGDDYPASANSTGFSFPLHLYDWTYARYRLAACNSAGCSRSAEVSVSSLRLDAVGYFKPSQDDQDYFGGQLDISTDGYNFVSAALGEDSHGEFNNGVAYLFRRGSNGVWTERARLTSTNAPYLDEHNVPLSVLATVSGTGNTVAVGIPDYLHQASDSDEGEVQVFQWNGASWVRTRVPRVSSGEFGTKVQLSDSGTTLAVGFLTHQFKDQVAVYKLTGGVWQNVRTITPKAGTGESCAFQGFSRDGSTLAQVCSVPQGSIQYGRFYIRIWSGNNWTVSTDIPLQPSVTSSTGYVSAGFAISAKGDTIAAQIGVPNAQVRGDAQVHVFKRGTDGVYSKVAELIAGPWSHGYLYGWTIAMSGDGATLTVGDFTDNGKGTGPRAAPLFAGANWEGGVYVYRLSGTWKLANMVKPNYLLGTDNERFGRYLALSGSGKTLLIGDPGENHGSEGIGTDWHNVGGGGPLGAVWMY